VKQYSCSDVNMGGEHLVRYEQLVSSSASIDKHLEVDVYEKIKLPHVPCKPPVTDISSDSEYLMPTDEAARATTATHLKLVQNTLQPVAIFNTDTNNICDCFDMNVDACNSAVNASVPPLAITRSLIAVILYPCSQAVSQMTI
jgi:hypothetical protein